MNHFVLTRPRDLHAAMDAGRDAEFIAGGTDMLQLLKERVCSPGRIVDLSRVLRTGIDLDESRLRVDAGVTMEQLATDTETAARFPALAQALLESASVQVRNLATIGGNLLQRTRCGYFRDAGVAHCNKRHPGSGCAAIGGENRTHAVLGISPHCIATAASDLAVVLTAFDATVMVDGAEGERRLTISALYRQPGDDPTRETTLAAGDIIVAVEVPVAPTTRRSVYLKVRDRASFEWALLSASVGLAVEDGRITDAAVAMGGVGTVPWRMPAVEAALLGQAPEPDVFAAAAAHATDGAVGHGNNDFKIALMPRVLARALAMAGDL
jgi:xanthine dehydrogenase YagS FAD-binding subunit